MKNTPTYTPVGAEPYIDRRRAARWTTLFGHLLLAIWSGLIGGVLLVAGEERAGFASLLIPVGFVAWGVVRFVDWTRGSDADGVQLAIDADGIYFPGQRLAWHGISEVALFKYAVRGEDGWSWKPGMAVVRNRASASWPVSDRPPDPLEWGPSREAVKHRQVLAALRHHAPSDVVVADYGRLPPP